MEAIGSEGEFDSPARAGVNELHVCEQITTEKEYVWGLAELLQID
jgi:hypothetical protein